MSTLPYLDIHTHWHFDPTTCVGVRSLSMEELLIEDRGDSFACAGIHPWWLEDITSDEVEKLKTHIAHMAGDGKLWAIGETGIDRLYPEFLDAQKSLFRWHQALAEEYNLPLVIHNVRAGSDFLQEMNTLAPKTPWIFHDFRGNFDLVQSLLRFHPDTFFSFGLSLDNSPQVRELLPSIPLQNLFLETDNQKHLDIHDIYLRASERLGMDLEFLKSQLWHNFRKLTPSLH